MFVEDLAELNPSLAFCRLLLPVSCLTYSWGIKMNGDMFIQNVGVSPKLIQKTLLLIILLILLLILSRIILDLNIHNWSVMWEGSHPDEFHSIPS
jgi:hypothetical protein